MSGAKPLPGCCELRFGERLALTESAETALEDYARSMARAESAEALRDADEAVRGVHLCFAKPITLAETLRLDVEAFARGLASPPGATLGWS